MASCLLSGQAKVDMQFGLEKKTNEAAREADRLRSNLKKAEEKRAEAQLAAQEATRKLEEAQKVGPWTNGPPAFCPLRLLRVPNRVNHNPLVGRRGWSGRVG